MYSGDVVFYFISINFYRSNYREQGLTSSNVNNVKKSILFKVLNFYYRIIFSTVHLYLNIDALEHISTAAAPSTDWLRNNSSFCFRSLVVYLHVHSENNVVSSLWTYNNVWRKWFQKWQIVCTLGTQNTHRPALTSKNVYWTSVFGPLSTK